MKNLIQTIEDIKEQKGWSWFDTAKHLNIGYSTLMNWKGSNPERWMPEYNIPKMWERLEKIIDDTPKSDEEESKIIYTVDKGLVSTLTISTNRLDDMLEYLVNKRQVVLDKKQAIKEQYDVLKAEDEKLDNAITALRRLQE